MAVLAGASAVGLDATLLFTDVEGSTALKSETLAAASRSLVTRVRQTSSVSPSGTKYVVSVRIPPRREPMTV